MQMWRKGLIALMGLFALDAPARADVQWVVDAVFDDGGTLTGYFSVNTNGQFYDFNLTSSGANGVHYQYGVGAYDTKTFDQAIQIQPGPYTGDLYLAFSIGILTGPTSGTLLSPNSFECQNSFSCGQRIGDFVRTIDHGTIIGTSFDGQPYTGPTGAADVPEPAAWMMMIAGFGGVGGAMRYRAKRPGTAR